MGRGRRTTVALSTLAVAAIGSGLLVDTFTATPANATELPRFNNCVALRTWVDRATKDQAKHPIAVAEGDVGVAAGSHVLTGSAEAAPAQASASAGAARAAAPNDAVGSSATGTNVQEAGVDEPDQVKTDGRFLVGVQAQSQSLWVAQLAGHTPHVIGRLHLNGTPTSLLLAGSRALVLLEPQIAYPAEMRGGPASTGVAPAGPGGGADIAPIQPMSESAQLAVVDLSDPQAPHLVAREDITGAILTARQVGDTAWVVTRSQPRQILQPGQPAPLLPKRTIRNQLGKVVSKGDALPCTAVRHPLTPSGSELLTVEPVDLTGATPFTKGRSAGVVAAGGYVYASAKRLYVATSTWGRTTSTHLHAFDISSGKAASYVGSGTVRGQLLSQWAMSEQDGYLRVATTAGDVVPPPGEGVEPESGDLSQTSVVVFAERGKRLVQVGHVSGLGRGERVWAVRFMGDLAAVVTFRQTDPLYLVDLSTPTKPRVTGALELTGYSSYLHPVGNGLLLGVGRDADSVGHVLNAKATLFDVHDMAHPRKVSNVDLGTGWSDVGADAHAFTYLPDRHLALLPLQGDGTVATAISVDGATVHITGHLSGTDLVERFVPVGSNVVAYGGSKLLDVAPTTLEVLGSTRVG